MKFSRLIQAGAVALAVAGCAGVDAPKYPMQTVRVVIPYPVGNSADVVGRIVVDKLTQSWGQPVAIENRAGPTTVPGTDLVAKAPGDGYTLLVHSVSFAVDASLYTNLPYDPAKDFVPIAAFARQPFALVASPGLGVKSVGELVARARTTKLKFGSLGPTTQIYFVGEQFRRKSGFEATHVAFKSLVEGNAAVAKGEVDFWFPPVAGAVPGVRDGKLVALAITGATRSASLPNVPTLAEAGMPGQESAAWWGLWAPAGTPPGIVRRIARDVEAALQSPEVREKLARVGAEPMDIAGESFSRFVNAETEASRTLTRQLGIPPQIYEASLPK